MADWKKHSNSNTTPADTSKFKTISYVLGFLLLIMTVVAIILGMRSVDFRSQTTALTSEVEDLNTTKGDLETELVDLETQYDTKIEENEGLKMTIEERVEEINNLQSKIRRVKSQLNDSKENTAQMEARLNQLEELKAALQNDVTNLKGENANLAAARAELSESLVAREAVIQNLEGKMVALNEKNTKIQNHLYKIAPAGYRAGNFSIDAEKRNDKLTAKARKAKEIKVNFDLPNVPKNKQGKTELYLVVTDVMGNAVKEIKTSPISVPSANENLKVEAADMQEINLEENQSLTLSFKPEDKMNAGDYNLMVYSSHGYLGATALSLR